MHELLAEAVEEIGVLAADHRRKKPIKINRPTHVKRSSGRPERGQQGGGGIDRAINMLMASTRAPR
ncbi:hypothetical protein [Nonomuraea basaltis]|uniref:hypothetical protein n=1 Tax=Nonomuraea basaltis TaxID=2495887 RepID=UPI00110C5ECF|nr:hypothetical protein [Nonomuraea basaltis]TMR93290.1 hypothetical protein EJK15_40015 [Nonomuraea basaltis]